MTSFVGRIMAGVGAFREAYVTAGMEGYEGDIAFSAIYDFESASARAVRYDILWAYYQGNAYRNLHRWSRSMKSTYGLYVHIRDIYNPANRICNFHQTHTWGGPLDKNAGDGSEVPSSLPIEDASDTMRNAIAEIWRWSKWHAQKDIATLYGAVYGDVFLRVIDDPDRKIVYIDRVHPGWIVDIVKNSLGETLSYEMSYVRRDPEKDDGSTVAYTEIATLEGGGVRYQTFKDNSPYAWNGQSEEWVLEFPFIPLQHIQHNDVGLDWGWSELFPSLSKFRELDDQASKLSDQIRKMVDSPWLFAGVKPGKTGGTITIEGLGSENTVNSEVTREETPIIYAHDPNARAYPLVSELDIGAALNNVKEVAFEIERSYPELRTAIAGRGRGSGDISGRALLIARQDAEDKVEQRRVSYDEGLVAVHKMAAIMASTSEYGDITGLSADQWDTDATFHRIKANRPVFRPHPSESLDQDRMLWTNAHLAANVGVPLDLFLRDNGWEEKRIQEIMASDMYQIYMDALELAATPVEATDDEGMTGDVSGRSAPSGGQDFDVATNKSREG